jgi:hypothetical protein
MQVRNCFLLFFPELPTESPSQTLITVGNLFKLPFFDNSKLMLRHSRLQESSALFLWFFGSFNLCKSALDRIEQGEFGDSQQSSIIRLLFNWLPRRVLDSAMHAIFGSENEFFCADPRTSNAPREESEFLGFRRRLSSCSRSFLILSGWRTSLDCTESRRTFQNTPIGARSKVLDYWSFRFDTMLLAFLGSSSSSSFHLMLPPSIFLAACMWELDVKWKKRAKKHKKSLRRASATQHTRTGHRSRDRVDRDQDEWSRWCQLTNRLV